MPIAAGKLRVLIATTNGPVEVLLLTEEDAAIGRCVACIGGTTETADIAGAYHAFVVRPTGIIEARFGHSCYRLDVSARIDAGSSWQLGVLAAHALLAAGRLAQESDTADAVLWATGSVRAVDLTVGGVSHVPEKLANSLDRLKQERAAGRQVLIALPAANAAEVPPALADELTALGIETVALARVQPLFDALAMRLPDSPGKAAVAASVAARVTPPPLPPPAPRAAAGSRRRWIVGAVAASVVLAAAGTAAILLTTKSESVVSSEPRPVSTPAPAPTRLDADLVPFITTQEKARIRNEYVKAPDYKALATSFLQMAFVSGQPSQEAANRAALAACEKLGSGPGSKADHECDLYAAGDLVVTQRSRPPMPAQPWLVRNPAVERPFAAAQIPLLDDDMKQRIGKGYPRAARSKALVLAPNRRWAYTSGQSGPDDAIRRSLERCGYVSADACMVVAIDDTFVVPIPTLAKVVGIYQPEALSGVRPDTRDEVARRLAGAPNRWNAVAVGADGNVGITLSANSEQSAFDGAMKDCAQRDRNCRIAVLGPFLVEAPEHGPSPVQAQNQPPSPIAAQQAALPPQPTPAPAPPPPAATPPRSEEQHATPSPQPAPAPAVPARVELVADLVPYLVPTDRERIRAEYLPAPDFKALAMSLTRMAFVIGGQPTQAAADQAAMDACKKLNPNDGKPEHVCDLYASGNVVVTRRDPPPMPAQPWIVRNPKVERAFATALTPLANPKDGIGERYPGRARPKALVIAANGYELITWSTRSFSHEAVIRRGLERCGFLTSSACMVVAIDDTFVVPIPTLAKVVGFYRPEALPGVQPQARGEVARRLAAAPNSWNAIAVGAGGNVGVAVSAASEKSAIDGALADCAKHDHACRLVVLGPFLVEAAPPDQHQAQAQARPPPQNQTPAPSGETHAPPPPRLASAPVPAAPSRPTLVPDLVPFVTPQDRARIGDAYIAAPDFKALAIDLETMTFVTGERSQEDADRAALKKCHEHHPGAGAPDECEVYAAGNVVVSRRAPPLMPPQPWIVRDPSAERPFAADLAPLVSAPNKRKLANYARATRPKAVALAPNGMWAFASKRASTDDAMRHSLERCSRATGQQCLVIAIDDMFVVPIPTLAKVASFFRPEALVGLKPEDRDAVARRLAGAPNGWNAVAIATGGIVGVAVGAGAEQRALRDALADCAAHGGRDCRITVLGPFMVEATQRIEAQNQGPTPEPRQEPAPAPGRGPPQSWQQTQEEKAPASR